MSIDLTHTQCTAPSSLFESQARLTSRFILRVSLSAQIHASCALAGCEDEQPGEKVKDLIDPFGPTGNLGLGPIDDLGERAARRLAASCRGPGARTPRSTCGRLPHEPAHLDKPGQMECPGSISLCNRHLSGELDKGPRVARRKSSPARVRILIFLIPLVLVSSLPTNAFMTST